MLLCCKVCVQGQPSTCLLFVLSLYPLFPCFSQGPAHLLHCLTRYWKHLGCTQTQADHLDPSLQTHVTQTCTEAERGGFFSYVAGTALHMLRTFGSSRLGGLKVQNWRSTLPMAKGLSSSAAVCVMVSFLELEKFKTSNSLCFTYCSA